MFDFIKLTQEFDISKLKVDLENCILHSWQNHFNTKDYNGKWSSYALRSISGEESDIRSFPGANYLDSPRLIECVYFNEIINSFKCKKESVRLLSLSPGSEIKEHTDNNSGYEDGFFRIHIPIQSNSKVTFRLNGKNIPMREGECWYANFNLPHYVKNEGDSDRIHLVIDCIRNDWSDQLFFDLGYDFDKEKKSNLNNETKLKMIEELSLMQTDISNKLIEQLKTEL